MKVLITGAQGQVGRSLIKVLTGHSVTAYSKNELDITHAAEISAALEKSAPDVVINAAAYTAVDEAESRPVVAYEINENGPLALAIATASREIPLVHFSTDYVFDGESEQGYAEDALPRPLSKYGMSKWEGEKNVIAVG
jgi:dTDP-4-dehydrorhamnose reductase